MEKVCWEIQRPRAETLRHLQESPSLWGSGWGLSLLRYWPWEGQGHVLSTCSLPLLSYNFDLGTFCWLLLSTHFLISPTGPLLALCTLFAVCFSGSGAYIHNH